MKIFEIQQTKYTPYFLVDPEEGYIVYKGSFLTSGSEIEFAQNLHKAINLYAKMPKSETIIEVFNENVNGANKMIFLELFREMKKIEKAGSKLTCLWHVEDMDDTDNLSLAEDVQIVSQLNFEIIDDSK